MVIPANHNRLPASTSARGYTARQIRKAARKNLMEYLAKPPRFLPIGKVLVHNHVKPEPGARGFRAWLDDPNEKYEVCTCG
jgi:hypothetical protein